MVIPSAATWARFLASVFSLVIASIYGVLASIVLALAGYRRIAQWSTGRMFVFLMYWSTGVSFRIEDPHNYLSTRPAVFIGNHQTELDVLMLGAMFPQYCVVTAKSSLKSWPFLGWYMTLSGSVFINRSNSTSAREAMSGAARDMTKERISVFMFPEGTRSYYKDPGLLPFKKGAFHLAVQAKVPVVPVVCANYSDVLSFKTMTFKSGVITIKSTSTSPPCS
jgi:lysophosphatidate acyltransferase